MTKIESIRFTDAGPDDVIITLAAVDGTAISYSMLTATLVALHSLTDSAVI